jgi:putative sterol carrier protein
MTEEDIGRDSSILYTFPSLEWSHELMNRLNADARFKSVGGRWEGDVNLYIEGLPGARNTQVIYIDSWHGTCRSVDFSTEEAARPAAFKIKAPLENWKRVLSQEIGPIQAMISGQVRVYGNLAYILRNVGGTQRMVEVAATIPTQFPV